MMTPHDIFHEAVTRWFADDGDHTLRLEYDIKNWQTVYDLGGYRGNWASDIYSMHQCNVKLFEPVPKYFDYTKRRFKKNGFIECYDFALGGSNGFGLIGINKESSSLFETADEFVTVPIIKIDEFITEETPLIKINIEGAEYELLENISEECLLKLGNIQVQFHIFVDDCMERRNKIREKLSKTHECTYNYDFVWENWQLKR